MIADIKNMPEIMAAQRAENKKDKYIEITNALLAEEKELKTLKEREEYTGIVKAVLDSMDFQIYELYRSLQEAVKRQEALLEEEASKNAEKPAVADKLLQARKGADTDREDIKVLKKGGRFAVIMLPAEGRYKADQSYAIYVNGTEMGSADTVVYSIMDLQPDCRYEIEAVGEDGSYHRGFVKTKKESFTINVRETGAVGDGVNDDTTFIQAAIWSALRREES